MQFKVSKVIIKSLPTKSEPCNQESYQSCIRRKISEDLKTVHNCSLPFLPTNGASKICPKNISLEAIELVMKVMKEEKYQNCENIKPCNNVEYILTPEYEYDPDNFSEGEAHIKISFKNTMVQVIEDSYDYNFISIFSEIGGSIGILTGISCMSVVEFLLWLHKKTSLYFK